MLKDVRNLRQSLPIFPLGAIDLKMRAKCGKGWRRVGWILAKPSDGTVSGKLEHLVP